MNIEEMKAVKIERGYSNEQVAQLSGVPLGTVQKIFAGITKRPRYDTLQALEKVFREEPDAHTSDPEESYISSYAVSDTSASAVCESAFAYGMKKHGEYTLEDYYAMPEGRRVELIDGVLYEMPTPTFIHQQLLLEIGSRLKEYIKSNGENCLAAVGPTDVRLDLDEKTMVQPDVFIVCDRDKVHPRHLEGAPDFVAEILSPFTSRKDLLIKLNKYADAGVREYWLVYPNHQRIIVYLIEEDDLDIESYSFTDKVPVAIFEGKCQINFAEIYEEIKFLYEK